VTVIGLKEAQIEPVTGVLPYVAQGQGVQAALFGYLSRKHFGDAQ
jgi:hypothetical protein